jgi:hypothetical protein
MVVEGSQASSGDAANGSKIKDTESMEEEEEEKAEEQAPDEESDEAFGGNQTHPLAQTETSNVAQQADGNLSGLTSPKNRHDRGTASYAFGKTPRKSNVTLAMEDEEDADEPSLHTEDDLEAGMNEAPGSSVVNAKFGGSLRQVSFNENLEAANCHDSLKNLFNYHHDHDESTGDNNSDSMTSMESNTVGRLNDMSGASLPGLLGTRPQQSSKTMVSNSRRVSLVVDIDSGKEGTRAQSALVRVSTCFLYACGCPSVKKWISKFSCVVVVYVMYRFERTLIVTLLVWELVDVEESNASLPKANRRVHVGATQRMNPTRKILMTQWKQRCMGG